MRVRVTDDGLEVLLSRWEKVLGLMGDIRLAREQVGQVEVIEDPMRATLGMGLKVGLRLPWVYYVARTIGLQEAFVVRRGVPALAIEVRDHAPLRRVLVSTPDAAELARRLAGARVA